MINKNTILGKIPLEVDPDDVFFLDGMRFSLLMANRAFDRLETSLKKISLSHDKTVCLEIVLDAYIDTWTFIDACHRFSKLWGKAPIITNEERKIADIDKKLSPLLLARNVHDHLLGARAKITSLKSSASGVLQWVFVDSCDPIRCRYFTIFPGPSVKNKTRLSLPNEDQCRESGVTLVSIDVGGNIVVLDYMRSYIAECVGSLERKVEHLLMDCAQTSVLVSRDRAAVMDLKGKIVDGELKFDMNISSGRVVE